ncbi:hypothetical protein KSF73_00085 [Burkholderiaceae bacterium DAT-1]|nr:hypothetical protein [Burkholderiaceae bacterium DAT-1]
MSAVGTREERKHGEPDSAVHLSALMKAPPTSKEVHAERMSRRGETRRRVEDLILAKNQVGDLW